MNSPQKKKVPIFNVEVGLVRTRDELEKLNAHLEDKVRERTEDLSCEIAQRERAEAALREERERYRELFENANDILYTLDLTGRVTSLNAAGEQIIGHKRREALGTSIGEILGEEYQDFVQGMLDEETNGKHGTAYQLEIVARDGRPIELEVSTRLVFDKEGRPVGAHGIARDVSERKKLEQQLRQAQKMEAIGNLAGGIAHNFNNMLTVILGYSHLILSSGAADSRIRAQVETIAGAAERSVALTRHLLTFSRNQILQPKVLDLNAVVRQTEKMLRPLIGENMNLVSRPGRDLGRVKADPGQIEQVIMNLAVNARDAMPDGGALIIETKNIEFDEDYIRWHPGARPGTYVLLKVTDTGCGMDQQTMSHIFEPFFTTKEAGKGTGLGLATVYGIVKQSGGHIWVYSEVGQGTTFKIYLPHAEESAEPVEPSEMRVERRDGGETILLVEDEAALRRLVHDMLERYGYTVLQAESAEAAIILCEQHGGPISLLLTDVIMTGMNGSQLADRLRTPHPEMKVLYMSGYTDGSILRHGVLRHGTRLIEKPFKAETLNKKLRETLGAKA